jgi:hypothetical protein
MPQPADAPSSEDSNKIVHIDARSHTFCMLLDLVEGNAPGVKMRYYCLSEIEQLLELGDRYGFNTLPLLLLPVMHRFAHALPWKVFAFAAKNDFEFLAAYALERLESDVNFNRTGIANFDHSLLSGFPTRYMVSLVRNITLFRKDDGTADWKRVAQNFPMLREVSIRPKRRLTTGCRRASDPP